MKPPPQLRAYRARPLPWAGPEVLRPGPDLVAGTPEPGELVDLVDGNGETFPSALRLCTPRDSGRPYKLGAGNTGGSLLRRARTPT